MINYALHLITRNIHNIACKNLCVPHTFQDALTAMLVKLAQVWEVLFISVYKYCHAFTMHALHIGTAMLSSADDTGRCNDVMILVDAMTLAVIAQFLLS